MPLSCGSAGVKLGSDLQPSKLPVTRSNGINRSASDGLSDAKLRRIDPLFIPGQDDLQENLVSTKFLFALE